MKIIKHYITILLVFFSMSGCRNFVELDPPKNLILTSNVFETNATAITALTSIYMQMVDKDDLPFIMSAYTGYEGDELQTAFPLYKDLYENNLTPTGSLTNQIWANSYNFIYQANAVYEGAEKSTSISVDVKKQLMAEAAFVRAFWHLYLMSFYGEIPIVVTTSYTVNAVIARSPKDQVYRQIIADLQYAQQNLNDNYVAGNTISTSTDRVRPNKAVATALLSRSYLYAGDYENAITQSSALINNSKYKIEDIDMTFLKESKEAIWQLMKSTPTFGINTQEGYNYILTSTPGVNSQHTYIAPQLLTAFDNGDLRLIHWIRKYTDETVSPSIDYYFPYKYKVQSSANVTEHSIVLRLAEQYLIRAEANAKLGNLAQAIEDTDVIRKRAGLTLINDTMTNINQEELLTAILKERQCELFAEWGHRWIDLQRSGTIDAVMNSVAPTKNAIWKSTKQLWPIPQTEIGNDPNLVQNHGYN